MEKKIGYKKFGMDSLDKYDFRVAEYKELQEAKQKLGLDNFDESESPTFFNEALEIMKNGFAEMAYEKTFNLKCIEELIWGIKMRLSKSYINEREKVLKGEIGNLEKKVDKQIGYT